MRTRQRLDRLEDAVRDRCPCRTREEQIVVLPPRVFGEPSAAEEWTPTRHVCELCGQVTVSELIKIEGPRNGLRTLETGDRPRPGGWGR